MCQSGNLAHPSSCLPALAYLIQLVNLYPSHCCNMTKCATAGFSEKQMWKHWVHTVHHRKYYLQESHIKWGIFSKRLTSYTLFPFSPRSVPGILLLPRCAVATTRPNKLVTFNSKIHVLRVLIAHLRGHV